MNEDFFELYSNAKKGSKDRTELKSQWFGFWIRCQQVKGLEERSFLPAGRLQEIIESQDEFIN